ncbi:MAG TPA: CBS domain-containing protein [Baekduia sp.]|nr:CBS domain-containing protein [Baekduia sp.]
MIADTASATFDDRVGKILEPGVLTCDPDLSLLDAARMMVEHRVHGLVVLDAPRLSRRLDSPWVVLTAADAVRGLLHGARRAGEAAATELLAVRESDRLRDVAGRMLDHQVDHVVVVGDDGPRGVLSLLDLLAVASSA